MCKKNNVLKAEHHVLLHKKVFFSYYKGQYSEIADDI